MEQTAATQCPQTTIPLLSHTPEATHAHLDHDRLMDCIHCGLCLSQCPTYAEEGLEMDSPRGRIYIMRSLAEGRAKPTASLVQHLDLCLGCRACETACPSGVQYGHLLEGARAYLRETYQRPRLERLIGKVVEATFPYPNRLELALLPVRVLRKLGILPLLRRIGFMKLLGRLGEMEAMLPPLPPTSIRRRFAEVWPARGARQAQVGMITGCVMQVMQSPVNEATARVLTKAGCEVAAPRTQGCCGALHAHVGAIEEAKALARKNIEAFEAWEAGHGRLEAIIINAAGCGSALKEYAGWFKDDPAWAERARAFNDKIKDVSEFLAQAPYAERLTALLKDGAPAADDMPATATPFTVISNTTGAATLQGIHGEKTPRADDQALAGLPNGAVSAREATDGERPHAPDARPAEKTLHGTPPSPRRLTYHDACHLAHGQGIRAQPRDLLGKLPHYEVVPLGESEMCCGSAGVYNITQPAMAMQLLERKMKHIAATGAATVVTGNPGCMIQIMAGAQKFGVPVQVKHPVELLDEATQD